LNIGITAGSDGTLILRIPNNPTRSNPNEDDYPNNLDSKNKWHNMKIELQFSKHDVLATD
jgi:hypothetical protein